MPNWQLGGPYSGDAHDLVPGSLRGYRVWVRRIGPKYPERWRPFRGQAPTLYSVTQCFQWTSGPQPLAVCAMARSHAALRNPYLVAHPLVTTGDFSRKVPNTFCTCGYYALLQPEWSYLCDEFFPISRLRRNSNMVMGSISASGRVVLGTRGFRAERCTIEAVVNNPKIAKRYGVPSMPTVAEFLEIYPPQDVSHLLVPTEGSVAE